LDREAVYFIFWAWLAKRPLREQIEVLFDLQFIAAIEREERRVIPAEAGIHAWP